MTDLTALDAANKALQTSPTVAKATKDYAAAATAVLHAMNPAPPPSFTVKGMYDANGAGKAADWPAIAAQGFNLIVCSADDSASLAAVGKTGGKAWVSCGVWTGTGFSVSAAQAASLARTAVATGNVAGLYVADEPAYSTANIVAVHARAAALQAACPGVETLIAYYDQATLSEWEGTVDAFALDIYPFRNGVLNTKLIPQLAQVADAAGLRYYGVYQAFTDGTANYPLPTPGQLQTMIAQWTATKQAGWAAYAWGSTGGNPSSQLQNQPGLLAVLKTANGSDAT